MNRSLPVPALAVAACLVLLSSTARAQWQADGVALSTAGNHQRWPVIASDGAGGAIMVWNDFRNGTNSDLYAQRISAAGTVLWALNGVPVVTGAGYQAAAAIVADGAGEPS